MPGTGNVLLDAIAGVSLTSEGHDNHITYFFDDSFGYHNWTAAQKTAYQGAMQMWANVANITTEEVFSSGAADFDEKWISDAYMQANFGNFGGYHEFPTNPVPIPGYYNADYTYFSGNGLLLGGYGFEILMHEI